MHLLLEMLMGLAAFGTAERPARHPPARWRTVGVLWLALLAALLLGWTASSVLPGSGTAWIVGWVVAASIVLVVTASCADVAVARRRRARDQRRSKSQR